MKASDVCRLSSVCVSNNFSEALMPIIFYNTHVADIVRGNE